MDIIKFSIYVEKIILEDFDKFETILQARKIFTVIIF